MSTCYGHLLHFTVIQLNIEGQALFFISLYDETFTPLLDTEAYSELSETSKMKLFVDIRNGLKP